MRLTKNNSIPPKSNNNRIAKNGEVNPFNLNNKYETASNPSKNPRLTFKIKPNKEKRNRNKRINPGIKIVNCKFKIENWKVGEKFKTKYPRENRDKKLMIKSHKYFFIFRMI